MNINKIKLSPLYKKKSEWERNSLNIRKDFDMWRILQIDGDTSSKVFNFELIKKINDPKIFRHAYV